MEDKKHLGADKEGHLEVYQKFPPLWKRRFCSLRGNCLFVFKEKGEVNEILQVPRLDDGSVNALGSTKKGLGQKNAFRFEISVEDQTFEFAAEDQQGMVTWVEAIKSCKSRNDARALSNPTNAKPQPQRTFVPIGAAPAQVAKQEEMTIATVSSVSVSFFLLLFLLLSLSCISSSSSSSLSHASRHLLETRQCS